MVLPLCLALILTLLSGCTRHTSSPVILAKVGSREISIEDFKREIDWRVRNHRPLPDKEALLEEMVSRAVLVEKARAAGLENDPDVRRSYEGLLVTKIQERDITPRLDAVKPTSEELHSAYEKNLAQYTRPAKARLAIVYIKTDCKMSAEKLAEAESRMQEALKLARALPPSSRGFDRVAVDFSEDQASRYKGGDIGWFDVGRTTYRWPAEVLSAGFAMNKSQISDIVHATNGLYLVSKLDSRDAVVTPLEQAQGPLQHKLTAEKRHQAEASIKQELRESARVITYAQNLAQVQYPTPTMAKAEDPLPPSLPTPH